MQIKKLIKVDGNNNNNKYYTMTPKDDETFTVKFGRVEGGCQQASYPMSRWDKKYKEKIKKGYKDITHMVAVVDSGDSSFNDIKDSSVASLVDTLQDYSNTSIKKNYTVSSSVVTQTQIDEAQKILNDISNITYTAMRKADDDIKSINEKLQELFTIIPRKMKKVSDHLIDTEGNGKDKMPIRDIQKYINESIANEQATLDVMAGSVSTAVKTKDHKKSDTILEAIGLEISSDITGKEIDLIKKLLGRNSSQFKNAYKIINKRTQGSFDINLKKTENKHRKLFWHGSRNENWWSILDKGLVLRPTNAVISGKMFGYGLYFADKAQKSIGYTSLRGSYWARGGGDRAYLALFDVHLGNYLKSKRHESYMGSLNWESLRKRGDYDSLFALGGIDLRNNEYIVYREQQATVSYIVEIGS